MNKLRYFIFLLMVAAMLVSCTPPAAPAVVPPAAQATATIAPTTAPAIQQPATQAPMEAPTAEPTPPPPEKRVDVIRVAGGDMGFPQPYTASPRGGGYVRETLIFDTLVWKDASGNFIPWLAESWNPSQDGLTWTIKLRPNVKWQDGQSFTADDVVFTYNYMIKNPQIWALRLDGFSKIEAVDALTVSFVLKHPYGPLFSYVFGIIPILPKHIWENVTDPKTFQTEQALIGTGPYRLVKYDKTDGSYLYEANDDFFLGAPYVKRIEMVPVSNETVALKQGDIDCSQLAAVSSTAAKDVLGTFQKDPKFGILTAAGTCNPILYFNMTLGKPFDDKAFRQAVAYSMDLQMMVDKVIFGDGLPGSPAYMDPDNLWTDKSIKPYPYDPAKAKSLLDAAGYIDVNKDGMRELPNGKPMKIELLMSSTETPRPGEMIKDWLAQIGVQMTVKAVERATADQLEGEAKYQMALQSYCLYPEPYDMAQTFSSKYPSKDFWHVHGWKNAGFEQLADQQMSMADGEARKQVVFQMEAILADELPVIPLYYPNRIFVFDKSKIDNWYFTPGGVADGIPQAWNKQLFVTGEQTGTTIRQ